MSEELALPLWSTRLREHRVRAGLTQEALAAELTRLAREHSSGPLEASGDTVSRWERGRVRPGSRYALALASAFGTTLAALGLATVVPAQNGVPPPRDLVLDDVHAAALLIEQAAASETTDSALTLYETGFDIAARRYATTPPDILAGAVADHLAAVVALLQRRLSHRHRRRALVTAGWLSVLTACLHVDQGRPGAATARLLAVDAIAEQTGFVTLAAWAWEIRAWSALVAQDSETAVAATVEGLRLAPANSSVRIQLLAQAGRAHARAGDPRAARQALNRTERAVGRLPADHRTDHHFDYDPAKFVSYAATTLAWSGEYVPAEAYARAVIADLSCDPRRKPRRLDTVRLDLGLVLAATDRPDEACHQGLVALGSGRLVPATLWRATELGAAVTRAWPTLPDGQELLERIRVSRPPT